MTQPPDEPLRLTEINGVPTVWAACDGPFRARLTFRVGIADERPLTRGVTHLVEHLALHGIERPGDHSNGHVDATTLNFHLFGDEGQVVERLARICRRLHDLPADRLAPETGILRAEAAQRDGGGAGESLVAWRYGAADYGLGTFEELGVDRLGIDDLHAWTRRYATRGNATLLLTGPPPAGLSLPLPGGAWQAPPDPRRSAFPVRRTTIPGVDGGIAVHALLERTAAATALAFVLRARLIDELRTRLAVAYSPTVAYERVTGDLAALFAGSDLLDGRAADGTAAFVRVLFDLLEGAGDGGNERYLTDYRTLMREGATDPQALAASLAVAGWDVLHRREILQPDEALEDALAVDAPALEAAMTEVMSSVLLRLPPSARRPGSWQAAPVSVHPPVTGTTYRPADASATATLIIGEDGVTRTFTDGTVTVRFDDLAVAYAQGSERALIGGDGSRVMIDATAWKGGGKAVAAVDAAVPSALVVRSEDAPGSPSVAPARPAVRRGLMFWLWLVLFVMIGAGAVYAATQGRILPLAVVTVSAVGGYLKHRQDDA